jgi:hypothetical protein
MRRRKKSSKELSEHLHAKRRFMERLGVDLKRDVESEIVSRIQRRKRARFVDRQSGRVTIWDVEMKGKWVRVVYDSSRHSIVTVLPEPLTNEEQETRCPIATA